MGMFDLFEDNVLIRFEPSKQSNTIKTSDVNEELSSGVVLAKGILVVSGINIGDRVVLDKCEKIHYKNDDYFVSYLSILGIVD